MVVIRRARNALRRAWLRWESAELELWLRSLCRTYAFNGLPADTEHARACRHRLAEIEVEIATLLPARRAQQKPVEAKA